MEPNPPNLRDERTETAAQGWLPQFCTLPTLFSVMVVTELIALVIMLTSDANPRPWLSRLGVLTVYAQWLALLCVFALCSLRRPLMRLEARTGFAVAWLLCALVTASGAMLVRWMDLALDLDFTATVKSSVRFVFDNAAIAALIAAALLRYLHVREQWRGRVQAVAKAQMDALQARIRPHFLFNSMNTIASLIRSRPAAAEGAVEDLADLFRAALGTDDALGTLCDELELVAHYLNIERLRLGERLRVDMDVAALPGDFVMPRLLLQPLIENAILHGIEPLLEGGTISVHGRRTADALEIEIRNPLPANAPVRRNGMAQANVRARIEYHFGARGELRVQPGPDIYGVTMHLPKAGIQ